MLGCFFGKSSISHLGFNYSGDGVSLTPEKTQSVMEWPTPKSPKELRSFLGLANFYQQFVPKFANVAAPLNESTGSKVIFSSSPTHQQSFEKLKHMLVSPPVMAYPTKRDEFILTTDASDTGQGQSFQLNAKL